MERVEKKSEIEKPAFLYHASPNNDIKQFKPRAESVRDPEEGPVIFASPDKAFASMFIVPGIDDSWCKISTFDGSHKMIVSDEKRFRKLDKGGAIYSLPNETFENDPNRNNPDNEWTSKNPVRPSQKVGYKTGLQAMIENGVQVYFVDQQTFEAIKNAPDHGQSIIEQLKPKN